MADALGLRVKELIKYNTAFDIAYGCYPAPYSNRKMIEIVDGFKNYLKDVMVGYENEEVLALLKQMDDVMLEKAVNKKRERNVEEETSTIYLREEEEFLKYVDMLDSYGQNFTRLYTRVDKMIVIREQLCNIKYNSNAEEDKVVVGFDDEIETLLDQLTGTSTKHC